MLRMENQRSTPILAIYYKPETTIRQPHLLDASISIEVTPEVNIPLMIIITDTKKRPALTSTSSSLTPITFP